MIGLFVSTMSPLADASVLHPNYVENTELRAVPIETSVNTPITRRIQGNVSAYTGGYVMANGERPHVGAVANDVLPFGTIVRINGREYVVKDRFGGDYGIERFDIYMDDESSCWEWGRQYITVEIIGAC
nr:MAG TPA: 3D containing protein [Caudoviricetes sp.]